MSEFTEKLLMQYPEFNFYMAPKILDMMIEIDNLKVEKFISDDRPWILTQDDTFFIPPLGNRSPEFIFCDFEGFKGCSQPTFFDWEYIYKPQDIVEHRGRKFHVFRHNVNKFKNTHQNVKIEYVKTGSSIDNIMEIYEEWLNGNPESEIQNEWVLEFPKFGLNHKVLYLDGVPVAFNVWDEGIKYTHFLINYSVPGIPFLNEFSRLLFYEDTYRQFGASRLVNDGGTLMNAGLEQYKDKLNPVFKRARHSWGGV
jgi:hypothetical protein